MSLVIIFPTQTQLYSTVWEGGLGEGRGEYIVIIYYQIYTLYLLSVEVVTLGQLAKFGDIKSETLI